MEKIARLSHKQREELFNETAVQMGLSPAVVEKDFWVCWVLKQIFADATLSKLLMFKGGTSLSKVFNLIKRFSEDIDLILDWRAVTDENPLSELSKTKQQKLNKEIEIQAITYIADHLFPQLSDIISPLCSCEIDAKEGHNIRIQYPAAFSDQYLRPEILLEIGPLASWLPHDNYLVSPYAAETFPRVFDEKETQVNAIKAERTFWEKVTEAHRPEGNTQPPRYSRHYYDMYMMAHSDIKTSALSELNILDDVVEFKKRFYPRGWANYDLAKPGTIKLTPEQHIMDNLKKDYRAMENMIFGTAPKFGEVMTTLEKLEQEINLLI